MTGPDLLTLGRESAWEGVTALVTGFGASGYAAADSLQHLGAKVTVVDESEDESLREKATILEMLGVDVRLGAGSTDARPRPGSGGAATDAPVDDYALIVTSPGWSPSSAILLAAAECNIPVWGEVELAWRLRGENPTPWLAVTGTNGKTTTVQMLESILRADGVNAIAVGNVGTPVVEAVMNPNRFDVLAVELSSFQLHWSSSISAEASAVLNVAPDHLDWHGDLAAYTADKAKIYHQAQLACVYNVEDPETRRLVEDAEVIDGCRAIGPGDTSAWHDRPRR